MSAEHTNKRRRASELGLLQHSPAANWPAELSGDQDPALGEDIDRPDVFEYLSQRSQRQRELEQTVQQLQESHSELSSKLQEAQRQISTLKAEKTGSAARYDAREAQLELRIQEQELALRREIERGARLQSQLRQAQEAQAAAEHRAEQATGAAQAGSTSSTVDRSQREQELRLRISELELALSQAVSEREEGQLHLQQQLQTEQQRCQFEVESNRLLQNQLEDAVSAAEAINRQKHTLESNAAELERVVLNLETQLAQAKTSEGDAVVVRNLREQLRAQESLVAEARKLKEQAMNVHVMREQLAAAEARAKRSEHLLDEQADLQARLTELEGQLQHWTLILEGTAECATPEDVLHFIQRLQADQVSAAARLSERADELASLKAAVSTAEEERARAEVKQHEAAAQVEEVSASLARAERKATLLTKERDGLKAILASYDEEYLNHQGGQILPQQTRIAELEGAVEGLHAHIRTLEEDLGGQSGQGGSDSSALQEALERAQIAEASVKALERQADNLMQQVALLEARLGRGEYNTATMRVLHFKYNPEAELAREAQDARVSQLENENVALKEHLQRLEQAQQGQDQAEGGGGMRVAQLEGENRLLKSRTAQAQKSAERLQQVFNKQITVFREAMYMLFGYRVEMTTDPGAREFKAQFALRPQQAEDARDELVFRLHKDGRMVLVPNSFTTSRLQREVDTFIERFKSIPAFTANLTMEWFQRHTQG